MATNLRHFISNRGGTSGIQGKTHMAESDRSHQEGQMFAKRLRAMELALAQGEEAASPLPGCPGGTAHAASANHRDWPTWGGRWLQTVGPKAASSEKSC